MTMVFGMVKTMVPENGANLPNQSVPAEGSTITKTKKWALWVCWAYLQESQESRNRAYGMASSSQVNIHPSAERIGLRPA